MQGGIPVDLPKTNTENIRLKEPPLVITIQRDGTIHLADQKFPLGELEAKLVAILDGNASQEVFVRGDAKVEYGLVAKVMAKARAAGVEKLGLVTERE
jgi:biopolymer transport protein ExbD